ncbi:MAG: hypothetical protein ABW061_21980 [Polyangiaceae bacterium]
MPKQRVRVSLPLLVGAFSLAALGSLPLVAVGCSSGGPATNGAQSGAAGAPSAGASGMPAGGANSSAGAATGSAGHAGSSAGGTAGAAVGGSAGMAGGAVAGASGASGASSTGGSGGSTSTGCGALPLCDDFEDSAVGSQPKSSLWTLVPSAASGSASVDSIGAHGSTHSLKIVSPDRLYLRNTSVIGTLGAVVHVRFYLRLNSTLADGHGAMIVTHPTLVDQYSQSNELRFGSQGQVFHWNTDSDAANIPDVSPNGNAASVKPAASTWYCVELTMNTNGHLNAAIDGMDVPGLTEDGTATANIDQAWVGSADSLARYTAFADFNFGWQSYGGGALTVWYDDVALSSMPIGCL